jgi:hypothetical protein
MSAMHEMTIASCGGPTLRLVPAPWRLKGSGLIMLLKSNTEQLKQQTSLPSEYKESLSKVFNILMLVNYEDSDCGPYQELLFIPGTIDLGDKRLPSISNIFVSSETSVVNGRNNWGIPKNRCDFSWNKDANGVIRVTSSADGQCFFNIEYRGHGPQFPANTAWIPKKLKTLGQIWEDQRFVFAPKAKGKARHARITSLNVASSLFPEISLQQLITAFEITSFDMDFPVPDITALNHDTNT